MTSTHAKREVLDELIAESQSNLDDLLARTFQEETLLGRLRAQRDSLGDEPVESKPEESEGERIPSRQNTLFEVDPSLSLPKQIERLLRFHDVPMRATDIARKLADQGVTTNAEKGLFAVVLSSLSKKTSTFARVSRGIYGLVEWNERNGGSAESA